MHFLSAGICGRIIQHHLHRLTTYDLQIRAQLPTRSAQFADAFAHATSCHATSGEGHKAAKARVTEAKVANVDKVVGVSKLKTKYEVGAEMLRSWPNAVQCHDSDLLLHPNVNLIRLVWCTTGS